jgi:Carboxypeptidase regulatory-like domain
MIKPAVIFQNLLVSALLLVSQPSILPGAGKSAARAQAVDIQAGETLQPVVGQAVFHDQSLPLAQLALQQPQAAAGTETGGQTPDVIPNPRMPKVANAAATGESSAADGALQTRTASGSMPVPLQNFEGVNNLNQVIPPDTQGDIGYDPLSGRKFYVQWVNLSFEVWDVTSTPTRVMGPVAGNTLWKNFGGPCEQTNNGDIITLYDSLAQRWLMSQFSVAKPYYQCIAISTTADPTGSWYRYAFLVSADKMNDYPHFGVWPDGYYLTINQFLNSVTWSGAGVLVFDRTRMLAGQDASFQYFDLYAVNPNFGGMLPSDLDGSTPPPAGAPNYLMEVDDSSWIGPQDALRLWRFHVDWNNPTNSTLGLNGQPNAVMPVAGWTPLCPQTIACIPQNGTAARLDGLGDQLMYRLAYRNFGDHQSLVVNHAVDVGGGQAGIRWYEVRDPGGSPLIYQQGTYAPDSLSRWTGSIAMDHIGNMALGYSVSSASTYPSIRYAGRLVNDPLGVLGQSEVSLIAGSGAQTSPTSRWGDYSMMGVDPVDDCTFWYTQEYYASTSSSSWQTRIGAFRFPSCSNLSPGTLAGHVTGSDSGSGLAGARISAQAAGQTPVQTAADYQGDYYLLLKPDVYTVTVQAYGYFSKTTPGVQIDQNSTTTLNGSLDPAPKYTLSGVIRDAITGWPLYAKIHILGSPFDPPPPGNDAWDDPVSGAYQISLAGGITYTLQVGAWTPGYLPQTIVLAPLQADAQQDFNLQVDASACIAPGYQAGFDGVSQSFDSGVQPAGWVVTHTAGTRVDWRFDNPGGRANQTGGTGGFAILDSDFAGSIDADASMQMPAFDATGRSSLGLDFRYDFYAFPDSQAETADVDVSIDGGASWTNVLRRSAVSDRGPKQARLDLSGLAANQADVQVRFHYYNANYQWWWQVDDVRLGTFTCTPLPGGLAAGLISDANTGSALPGSHVLNQTGGTTLAGVTTDPNLSGAFYTLFSPVGSQVFTATQTGGYGAVSHLVDIQLDQVSRQDFSLPAGWLHAAPASFNLQVFSGYTATQPLTLTNQGGLQADFNLVSVNTSPSSPFSATFAPAVRRASPAHLDDTDARSVRIYNPPEVPEWPGAKFLGSWQTGLRGPWGLGFDPSSQHLWVGDIGLHKGADRDVAFQLSGLSAGRQIDTQDWIGAWASGMAYDLRSGSMWQLNVGAGNCLVQLDLIQLQATGEKICPPFAASQRALAYDPTTDTFLSGSWNDQTLYLFDRQGRLIASDDTGLNIAAMVYVPQSRHLYVLVNASGGKDIYVLDGGNRFTAIGGFDVPGLGDFQQAGLAMDCSGNLWALNQETGEVVQMSSGESSPCSTAQASFLSAKPTGGTIAPAGSQPIELGLDATALDPGIYHASLVAQNNTPYGVLSIPVTMTVVYRYNLALAPLTDTKIGNADQIITHTLTVTNTGVETDGFQIALTGNSWPTESPLQVGPLSPGLSVTFPVAVRLPPEVNCASRDSVTVMVTSQGDPKRFAQAVLTTRSPLRCEAVLGPEFLQLNGVPGESLAVSLQITNTGNVNDSFSIKVLDNPLNWKVTMPDSSFSLAVGQQAALKLLVRVGPGARPGDVNALKIGAVPSQDPASPSAAQINITAVRWIGYFPFFP